MGAFQVVQGCVSMFQIFLGSASIYSLLNGAIAVGLSYMFALYLIGFVKSRIELKYKKAIIHDT